MVEPQELSTRSQILDKQQNSAAEIMNEGRKLPEEMVTTAEHRVTGFKTLKAEIGEVMAKSHEVLDGFRKKIQENILSDENRDGLLTGKLDDYLNCLEIKYLDFELLLRKDETKWAENLEIMKKKSNEVNE